ncbi:MULTISPECIES: non-reducing end alpha-L-arabinofuranosidase family hydrolase [unclassified Microbulbifer]|uniref:non-reducing end alpha-L-arabinofuranosidase family hydrolase n=1 Tax=unclassified Microbulbifer TaxID=2619833 RepID=UPI0027E3FADA|nr:MULTISPECIES: non-reducing end alpha-L-arabinofuranosidase family hydrolase [unclassified Microbulbifer]
MAVKRMNLEHKKYLKGISAAIVALGATCLTACATTEHPKPDQATAFQWESSNPLISPPPDDSQKYHGVKDPSIVHYDGKYHLFMTTAGSQGWAVAYTSFRDWDDAPKAQITGLDKSPMGPGYRAAPQVLYFAPQKLWYLIYQGGDPLYSTSNDISDPLSWSVPAPFFETPPDIVKHEDGYNVWLDFWNICDDETCYLFFTNDNGDFYRAETPLEQFPKGFHNTTLVMKGDTRDDLFEASNTYKIAGANKYLTLIEAIGPKGRYFRAWTSDSLAGDWQALTPDPMNVFADSDNVNFEGRVWSEGVSHGEMIRASSDQTLTIDPCKPLQYLYQGLDMEAGKSYEYIELPYKLGILTASAPNPISNLCNQ